MTGTDTATRDYSVGRADIDAEHALQYKLLAEAEQLLVAGDTARAKEVVQQLLDYSEVHFGSEQVIMRLHSYPEYHAHVREHGDLLAALRNMLENLESGPASASTLRRWLSAHVHHADQAFAEFMQRSPLSSESS